MPKKPLKYRELRKRLKKYGVVEFKKKGKGSERIFLLPTKGPTKGPQYPVKCHGEGTEISYQVIDRILARFGIDPESFWD